MLESELFIRFGVLLLVENFLGESQRTDMNIPGYY